jgi:hypothetical protein
MADGEVKDETSSAASSTCRSAVFRRRSRPIGAGHQEAAARRGERPLPHRMPAFCSAGLEARPAATRRSGHFGQCRGIILAVIQVSELRQRLSRSVNRQRLLPATLTLRDWRSRAPTNLPNRRGQSGDRLALSGLPRSADSVHLAGQLSVGFGRLLAVGGAADGGEHVSATSKAAREAGYRLGSDRGCPNHGSTLASKRVMPQIWPPARVST